MLLDRKLYSTVLQLVQDNFYCVFCRYSYDPFVQSLNDNPEHELPLASGDYILIWGHHDEDGYFTGELLDGRKGIVPSNLIEKLTGEDLLEFHR